MGLVGFKWKETHKMFGKEATEIMWITSFFLGGLMKGSMEKELLKDLTDIMEFVEQS